MGKELDRVVMQAAVTLSRRNFFKKLPGLGLGAGLGLAGVGRALAGDCTTQYRDVYGSCRSCTYLGGPGVTVQKQSRECCPPQGCSSWQTYSQSCDAC